MEILPDERQYTIILSSAGLSSSSSSPSESPELASQFSSTPHATSSEFIAEATDRHPNTESPPRKGPGNFVRRPKVSPARAHRLHLSLSFPRHQIPSLLNCAHALHDRVIAAFHAHQSSQAPKQRPRSSAEQDDTMHRVARYDASGEFTARDTSPERMRKTNGTSDLSREATTPLGERGRRVYAVKHLAKPSDVSHSSSPRRHHGPSPPSMNSNMGWLVHAQPFSLHPLTLPLPTDSPSSSASSSRRIKR
ncbi:uncharacterized protein SCHCODRAFT_01347856 [Schizophyllum commune H4-8]|nr:uncharacterized protein SCHCODRAFT_01347856 [Schizophyllum commune H4-8]KAI5894605.1 hypothetical protein SCHCODRAFT_01347856 [Schizophyllum commune H4-8]